MREAVFRKTILPAEKAYTEAPASYKLIDTTTPLNDLNNGLLDIAIVRRVSPPRQSDESEENEENDKNNKYGFVGNVMESVLLIFAPNNGISGTIHDLSDLKSLTGVTIRVNNPAARQMLTDILDMYPEASGDVRLVDPEDSTEPTMYAFLVIHPHPEVASLVKSRPMHVVTMQRINGGDYFVSGQVEEKFYKQHIHYEKGNFNMHYDGVKYYPGLSIRGQLLYYPTVKYKYSMYARLDFSEQAIYNILVDLMNKGRLSQSEISFERDKSMLTHPGARKVYIKRGLYTYKPRPEIWQGF